MNGPEINVGIMSRDTLRLTFCGEFLIADSPVEGSHTVRFNNGKIIWNGVAHNELLFKPATGNCAFELHDVMIGINFHWQRTETQRFAGALKIIPDCEAQCCVAINVIGTEEYLKSVISSEMKATASPALLRAHAVVSRGWLLRQIADRGKHSAPEASQIRFVDFNGWKTEELIKWYDREDHLLFDVCADDHCQRYQGITRLTTPEVAAAVDDTAGMALTYNGEICDARFSKCCGGITETFGNCWENVPHPYLQPVHDCDESGRCYCNTNDAQVLDSVLNNYDRETNDFYRWEITYDAPELSELVKRRSGIDFGMIQDLVPLERGESGRIVRLLVKGSRRSMIVGKELEIRRWLSESHLRSSAFEIERTPTGGFTLHGSGWGHGVGMCQIGAAVMGAEGHSYQEILSHYFPKAQLTKLY